MQNNLISIDPPLELEGLSFNSLQRCRSGTHSIAYSDKYIAKLEHARNKNKRNSLFEEAAIIRYLNRHNCVSVPKLICQGEWSGVSYLILQRIEPVGRPKYEDILFSLVEQKNLGVYQGDLKWENFIFSENVCYLIDYDQAVIDPQFKEMDNISYLKWIENDFQARRGEDFFQQVDRRFDKSYIYSCFKDKALDIEKTSLMESQQTTATQSGVYHSLASHDLVLNGSRTLKDRISILDNIPIDRGEKILDVGCNLGIASHYLHDRGATVTGIDLDGYITRAAKIVSNILNKDIAFFQADIGNVRDVGANIDSAFDTICLFSVLHHVKNIRTAGEYIAQHCNRIILECKLIEGGSMPADGKNWVYTSGWQCSSKSELIDTISDLIPDFVFDKDWGAVDRNRSIYTFVKKDEHRQSVAKADHPGSTPNSASY